MLETRELEKRIKLLETRMVEWMAKNVTFDALIPEGENITDNEVAYNLIHLYLGDNLKYTGAPEQDEELEYYRTAELIKKNTLPKGEVKHLMRGKRK